MDGVLVNFQSGIDKLSPADKIKFKGRYDECPGIFGLMEPMPKAIESIHILSKYYDMYLLSTAAWLNPSAWSDKIKWVHRYFGYEKDTLFYKRLILSHNKHLNKGEYLIDDRPNNGAKDFNGEWIHFGSKEYPEWDEVLEYLL